MALLSSLRTPPAVRWAKQIAEHEADADAAERDARWLTRCGLKPWAWDAQDRAVEHRRTATRMRTCLHQPPLAPDMRPWWAQMMVVVVGTTWMWVVLALVAAWVWRDHAGWVFGVLGVVVTIELVLAALRLSRSDPPTRSDGGS